MRRRTRAWWWFVSSAVATSLVLAAACGSSGNAVTPIPGQGGASSSSASQSNGSGGGALPGDASPDVHAGDGAPCVIPTGATPSDVVAAFKACAGSVKTSVVDGRAHRELDVLFLIDNSSSMASKQAALVGNIASFVQSIDATAADYHIGVATSDVGAWTAASTPFSQTLGACDTFQGDDGALQATACSSRVGTSNDEQTACATLCPDGSFVPQGGVRFIAKTNGVTNVPVKMVGGHDVGPVSAFKCIGLDGDRGCGIEGQLEGMKRALDGHGTANAGFLRPSSVLAVIVLTDEDDCSVALANRAQNSPVTKNCATPDAGAAFDCFNVDYRCMAADVTCNEPLNTEGAKHGCVERATSYLEPVASYAQFLNGLRPPSRLFLGGIWAPGLDNGGIFNVVQNPAAPPVDSENLNRATGAAASCISTTNTSLYARPQLRLSKLAAMIPGSMEIDVCDDASLSTALPVMAAAVKSRLDIGCTAGLPMSDANGAPLCVVGDVDASQPSAAPATAFPACSSACCSAWANASYPIATDTSIRAACAAETASACFCALPSTQSGVCAGAAVAGVWRKDGASAPTGTVTTFECAE